MSGNGQAPGLDKRGLPPRAGTLRWSERVLSADDLRRHLNGAGELVVPANAVITPLAAEHLRAHGVRLSRQAEAPEPSAKAGAWGYAQEQPQPLVATALQALAREGLHVRSLQPEGAEPCAWARAVADCVAGGSCHGGVVFCADAGLTCCVANKVKGLRAAVVTNAGQATRALRTMGANLLVVEMPGRSFFEIRQIVRCVVKPAACPPCVACVLQELDGHAHR
jgi:ribose 5-phosphate isomerase RpiB